MPLYIPNMPTPASFGCKVGPGHKNHDNLQRWLNEIAASGPVGYGVGDYTGCIYETEAPLVVRSGTEIICKKGFGLKTRFGDATNYLLANEHFVGSGSQAWIDKDIKITGMTFYGDPATVIVNTMHDFVDFIGVDGLTLRDCSAIGRKKDCLVLSNNNNVLVDNFTTSGCGQDVPPVPVDGWAGGCDIFCLTPNFNMKIINSTFANGGGSAIWLPVTNTLLPPDLYEAQRVICTGNNIWNKGECGIIGAPRKSIIAYNIIDGIALCGPSGNGMELHGEDFSVLYNQVYNTARPNVFCGDIQRVNILGNTFGGANRLGEALQGALVIDSMDDSAGMGTSAPNVVNIDGNLFIADANSRYAILLGQLSSQEGRYMKNIQIGEMNNYGVESDWKLGLLGYYPDKQSVIGA